MLCFCAGWMQKKWQTWYVNSAVFFFTALHIVHFFLSLPVMHCFERFHMSQQSLPCDAKLVRYMLLSYFHHLPVCLYATSQHSIETTVQIELLLAWRLLSTHSTLCCNEIWVSPKIQVLSSGSSSQTLILENFSAASRLRCQQNSLSSSLLTVPIWQEALLPQVDHATFCVSQNLVNCRNML